MTVNTVSGKNRCTGDLVALLTETWNRSVHFFGESKVVALDISKASDRVWHQGLISKVKSYAVGNAFIRWPSEFLCNRWIPVVIDGINSNLYPLNSGVPQGSVIFPTLFLVFLNDLLCLTTNPIYSFADDSSLCHSYSYKVHPYLNEVDVSNFEIEDWGVQMEWNLTRKTECCLLSH